MDSGRGSRGRFTPSRFDCELIRSTQARHFKSMMKETGHLDKVKKLRISDKDLARFAAAYDVRNLVESLHSVGTYSLTFHLRPHFPS